MPEQGPIVGICCYEDISTVDRKLRDDCSSERKYALIRKR
jgi:hypothetical protein